MGQSESRESPDEEFVVTSSTSTPTCSSSASFYVNSSVGVNNASVGVRHHLSGRFPEDSPIFDGKEFLQAANSSRPTRDHNFGGSIDGGIGIGSSKISCGGSSNISGGGSSGISGSGNGGISGGGNRKASCATRGVGPDYRGGEEVPLTSDQIRARLFPLTEGHPSGRRVSGGHYKDELIGVKVDKGLGVDKPLGVDKRVGAGVGIYVGVGNLSGAQVKVKSASLPANSALTVDRSSPPRKR